MTPLSFTGLINNVALLLAMGIMYSSVALKLRSRQWPSQLLSGFFLGLVGIGLMMSPWQLTPGVVFDARSILLSVGGLFLGLIPTAVALVMTCLYRLYEGGIGAWTGSAVIITSGLIGWIWAKFRQRPAHYFSGWEYYLFGITVHISMLLWMLSLPHPIGITVLKNISLPVLLIFPVGTVLFAKLLAGQEQQLEDKKSSQENEERFRALADTSPLAIYASSGVEQKAEYINPAFIKLFGYTIEEVPTAEQWWPLAFPDEDYRNRIANEWQERVECAIETNSEIEPMEAVVTCKDGSTKTISWGFSAVGRQNWALGLDLTDRKQAEEKLIKSQRLLDETGRIGKVGGWEFNIDTGFMQWTEEVYHIHEVSLDYDVNLEKGVNFYSEASRPVIAAAVQRVSEQGEPFDLDLELVTAKGNLRNVHAIGIADLEHRRVYGFIQDITDKKSLETKLLHSQKMEAVGTMAGGIAHEFNNLLAIISGNLDVFAFKQQTGTSLDENLQQIGQASSRAIKLTQQILAFSRHETPTLVPVNLTNIVTEALTFLRPIIPSTVEVETRAPDRFVAINADSIQLQQVIINLCSNAVHAMNEKGQLQISLEEAELKTEETASLNGRPKTGQYAKLSITDTGKGMDKQTTARVFEPFFTTKRIGEGTGMGLAVAHGIIEQHGGFVHVDSTLGQGTTFTLYFPITSTVAVADVVEAEEALPTGTEHILLVDDEQLVADVCGAMLEHLGYKVTVVNSGIEALDLFKLNPGDFDLVMTDQTMPKMSGTELASELLIVRSELPVVLCSGYSAKVTETEAKKIGIRAFCMKPIAMPQLASVIRETLDTSELPSAKA